MGLLKNNQNAVKHLENGDKLYNNKNYYESLINYNKSVCSSEINSFVAAKAYARRSAVYFVIKSYDKCLKNIQLARDHGYPKDNIEVLNKRQEKCIKKLNKVQPKVTDNLFKLSHEANEKNPSIAACLQLREDQQYGRHIITDKDLKVGDIIAIEPNFVGYPQNSEKFSRCYNCFKSDLMDLIPCNHCADGKTNTLNKLTF